MQMMLASASGPLGEGQLSLSLEDRAMNRLSASALMAQRLASQLAHDASRAGASAGDFLMQCLEILRETLLKVRPAWRNERVRITPIPVELVRARQLSLFKNAPHSGGTMESPVPELRFDMGEARNLLEDLPDLGQETPRAAAALLGIHEMLNALNTDGLRAVVDAEQAVALRIEICMQAGTTKIYP